MKLALGTAQFGMRYGVANTAGRVPPTQIAAILSSAAASGIDTLDTAIAYGDSEARLGEIGVTGWQIITKLPPLAAQPRSIGRWVDEQVTASLRRLKAQRLTVLLVHRATDLSGAHGVALHDAMLRIKQEGRAELIGASIYDPLELDALWPMLRPDVIQAPLNVLDRRLVRSGWLQRMVEEGVRVHSRSTFLQGLLLMPAGRRPAYFRRWKELLDRWLQWCTRERTSPLKTALAFVLSQPGIERVIVGVDSVEHLKEVLAATKAPFSAPPDDFSCEERDLIEPSRWRLA